jgi:hypothetical protein
MNRESSQQFRHKQYGWVYKISYVHKTWFKWACK